MARKPKALGNVSPDKQIRVPLFLAVREVRQIDDLAAALTKEFGTKYTRSDAIRFLIRRGMSEVVP